MLPAVLCVVFPGAVLCCLSLAVLCRVVLARLRVLDCAVLCCLLWAGWCLFLFWCLLFLRICWWVWLLAAVSWHPGLAFVSLAGHLEVALLSGVACFGALLPRAVSCGAVLPCDTVILDCSVCFALLFVSFFPHDM